jgi:hypothetical protein
LLLFLKYDFIVMYKPKKIHVIVDVLLILLDIIKLTSVHDQTIYASLFYIEPEWLNDVIFFLKIG